MKLKDNEIGAILNYLENANPMFTKSFFEDFADYYETTTKLYESDDFRDFVSDQRNYVTIVAKCLEKRTGISKYGDEEFSGTVELNFEETKYLSFFIDTNFLEFIREDKNIDNLIWIKIILEIYERCEKELKKEREKA